MAWRLPFFQLTVVVALTRSVNEDSRDVISCVAVECDGLTEDTVSLLMTVPQNPEKSNNALGPATGGGSGGGQLAQLGQVSNFLSKSSEPDRMPHPDHFDETWDRLKGKTAKLPLCRAFPKYCDVQSVTYKVEVLAASMMWESLLGVGGAVVILQILMFYIAGVCWNTGLLGRLWPRVFGADGSDERGFSTPTSALDPAEPHLAGWASWLAPPQLAWPMKTWCQWWQLGPRLSRPIATMQLYVCCLLLVEILALVTPNSCVLATAEMVGFVRKYPRHFKYLPHFGEWFMPNFEDNVDAWVSFLIFVRRLLVVSWSLFILLPQKRKGLWQVALGVSYSCGALAYTYLSMIELTYQPSHTVQGTTLFVFSAMFVVPFLETNPMAGNWLRKFLLLNVVIPAYWFAGLSKIRYAGLLHNFSGAWVKGPLQYKMDDSLVTGFSAWLLGQPGILGSTVPWTCVLFSWGNFLVEIVLPVAAMLSMTEGPVRSKIRLAFLILAVSFHVGIWILMSPNFIRSVLLLIFATNPASLFDAEDEAAEKQSLASTEGSERLQQSAALVGEYLRAIYGMAMWTGWNLVELLSDYDHLAGNIEPKEHHDMYFPFSEFPMFAPSTKETTHAQWSCAFLLLAWGALLIKMIHDVNEVMPP